MRTSLLRFLFLPFVVFGIVCAAGAQIPDDLDPAKKSLVVKVLRDLDPDQEVSGTLEVALNEVVDLLAQWVDFSAPKDQNYWYEWRSADTNDILTVLDARYVFEAAPSQTLRFVVYHGASGNWGEAVITVIAGQDTTPPTIWLNGLSTMYVPCGGVFIDPGAQATDDSEESPQITIAGAVNTYVVGSYTLTYTATDGSGNSASVDRTVNVVYPWSGFEDPVSPTGQSIFKLGSVLPLKFSLTGSCAGDEAIVARLYLAKVSNGIAGTEETPVSVSAADTGNIFRYNDGKYMYNLSTKGLSEGTWQLRVDLGDGALHAVHISLRK